MLEVEIQHIASARDGSPERFLILRVKDDTDRRVCPIVIGHNEAAAIIAPSRTPAPARPMTHDLLFNVITELGAEIEYIYIRELRGNTFCADIMVRTGEDSMAIDARVSDSIALAVRARVPIFIAEEVIDKVSSELQASRNEEEASEHTRSRRSTAEKTSPVSKEQRERLSAYSDFIETLSLSDDDADDASGGPGQKEPAK